MRKKVSTCTVLLSRSLASQYRPVSFCPKVKRDLTITKRKKLKNSNERSNILMSGTAEHFFNGGGRGKGVLTSDFNWGG